MDTKTKKNLPVTLQDVHKKNISEKVEPLKKTSRLKAFILHFISVPAKWIRTGRQNVLNLYTHKAYYTGVFLE